MHTDIQIHKFFALSFNIYMGTKLECNYFSPISVELSIVLYIQMQKSFACRCYNILDTFGIRHLFNLSAANYIQQKMLTIPISQCSFPLYILSTRKQKLCKKIIMPHNEIKGYREKVYLVFAIYVFLKEIMLI